MKTADDPISEYLAALRKNLAQGDATEHTHRAALQQMVESIASGVETINEAKRIACGAPDLTLRKGKTPLGHIETKDIGTPLDEVERGRGPHGEQFKRYKAGLPNWILTDYLRFDWFVGGEFRKTAVLATLGPNGKLKAEPGGAVAVEHLLHAMMESDVATVETAKELARRMAGITHILREMIENSYRAGSHEVVAWLSLWLASFRETLIPELKEKEFADMFAQTLAYGLFAARIQTSKTGASFSRAEALLAVPKSNPFLRKIFSELAGSDMPKDFDWAVDDLVRLLERADIGRILADFGHETGQKDPIVHFYETFLAVYDPKLREKRGVYYTPEPVVKYIVRSVDSLLKTHFGKPRGLADEKTLILDPATGTATFLYFVIEQIRQSMKGQEGAWPGYVRDHLLNRIFGFELLMAPYAVAHLKLGLQLEQTGYIFGEDERLGVYLTNTLEEAAKKSERLVARVISDEANAAVEIKRERPILVVLGNPPYSGISANANEHMRHVDAGGSYWTYKKGARREQSNRVTSIARRSKDVKELSFIGELMDTYKWIDGSLIKEQKSWLNNDYAKFIRFAQWRLETTGDGILAFITDNSYLDKSSFRAMRWNLMQSFSYIYILNLHGRSKPTETSPNGFGNENVFDIQQGVAILLAVREPGHRRTGVVRYADLWGTREEKYAFLNAQSCVGTDWHELSPCAPLYLFEPNVNLGDAAKDAESKRSAVEWGGYFPLDDAFRVASSGFTTARDYFLMSTNRAELQARIDALANRELSDEDIRDIYFKGRGADKYPDGDSRGWKLAKARLALRSDTRRTERIRTALYRPFNDWYVYWADYMVDWPRAEVMKHLDQSNWAILYSRNVEIGRAEHFFCTDKIAGHHSVSVKEVNYIAPLYLYEAGDSGNLEMFGNRRPNLSLDFLNAWVLRLGLRQEEQFGLPVGITAEDIFNYIYAVFHAPGYRTRYAEFLKRDFPRVPLTADLDLFQALAAKGRELVALHLLRTEDAPQLNTKITRFPIAGTDEVTRVRYVPEKQRVEINDDQYFSDVPAEIWEFTVGGYQVCEKWLKDRKGRVLSNDDIEHWQRVVVALGETRRLMAEINALIPEWPLR
jgi:predicted helicase